MKALGLGDGQQNHTLRKRKPVLLSEQEMSNKFSISKGKQSLKDIADQFNAVNKNTTLQKAFENGIEQKNQLKWKELF